MDKQKIDRIIKLLALCEGVREEQIRADMEFAIQDAYKRTMENGDPDARAMWKEIAPDGNPSVYDFLSYTAAKAKGELPF